MFLKQSTSQVVQFGPCLDKTDGVTEETSLTLAQADMRLSKDGGNFAQKNAVGNATHDSDGWYYTTLDATDTNTVGELILNVHQPANMLPVWQRYYVVEEAIYDALFAGSANAFTGAAGSTQLTDIANDVIDAAVIATGAIDADSIATDAITNAKIAADAIGASEIAANAITSSELADGAITAAKFGAGAIDAAAIATDAIDADALATDAVTEIRSLVSGTADSGTVNTMVDAARTEADTDYWKNCWILFTSGNIANQVRLITGFTPASDTITFAPDTTNAVATNTYEILPAGSIDLRLWAGVAPNALIGGAVDADVSAIQADAVTATAVATDAIGAAELATDAVNEIRDAILSDSTAFAGANIDATISSRAAASVVGALADAAAAGDPTASDTLMQYVKQLVNVLVGTTGVTTFPAAAAPANNVSLAEIIRSIYDDSNELQGDWVDTGRLDAILDARASQTTADAIETDTQDIQSRLPAALVGGRMDSDVEAINNDTEAADDLAASVKTVVTGAAIAGTLSTTQMTTDLTEATDDHYNGRIVIWTSGVLKDQASDITDYAGATKMLTYTAVTEAPSATDSFVIV